MLRKELGHRHQGVSFAGAETVMQYLGRCTHRIDISNNRILRMDENNVTFKVKEYKDEGKWKKLTLNGIEFVRRFLMHVPPKGFVRIRHYGLLSNHNKRKLIPVCRNLIGCRKFLCRFRKNDRVGAIRILYGKDISVCPNCGKPLVFEKSAIHEGYRRSTAWHKKQNKNDSKKWGKEELYAKIVNVK